MSTRGPRRPRWNHGRFSALEPASAIGGLAKTPFLHIVMYAFERQLTGSLALREPPAPPRRGAAAVVFFSHGLPAKAWTSGAPPEAASVRAMLKWVAGFPPEATFAYYDRFDAVRGLPAPIDPLAFIASQVRESPSWAHVNAVLARVANVSLRLSKRAEIARLELSADELRAVERLHRGPMRVPEFTSAPGLAPHEAERLLYCLLITKQVEPVIDEHATLPPIRPRLYTEPDWANGRLTEPSEAMAASPLAARRTEILERSARIDRETYFEMLGVSEDASPDQIQHAYFTLAKTWHPDRLPPQLADVRDACSRVFARLNDAYETLSDPARREQYRAMLAEGSGTPEAQETVARVLEAASSFQKAEVCFRRNDFTQAEALCRRAHEADPTQADYLALLAWLEAQKPENQSPGATHERIEMLDRAIEMNVRCGRAYHFRGMLHKRLGNMAAAVRDFREAVELDPRNIDAARELRIYEMRRSNPSLAAGKAPASARAGLLGRLFKR